MKKKEDCDQRRCAFHYPTRGHRPTEGAITSRWPERSGGIRRAVMATSEAVAITGA